MRCRPQLTDCRKPLRAQSESHVLQGPPDVIRDGTLFPGDGGNLHQRPTSPWGQADVLMAEKLVNMAKHQYRLEPNVSFQARSEVGGVPLE